MTTQRMEVIHYCDFANELQVLIILLRMNMLASYATIVFLETKHLLVWF